MPPEPAFKLVAFGHSGRLPQTINPRFKHWPVITTGMAFVDLVADDCNSHIQTVSHVVTVEYAAGILAAYQSQSHVEEPPINATVCVKKPKCIFGSYFSGFYTVIPSKALISTHSVVSINSVHCRSLCFKHFSSLPAVQQNYL